MLHYDPPNDRLTLNGKPFTKKHPDFMQKLCEYVIAKIAEGKDIADLAEIESKVWPSLASILSFIEADTKLAESMAIAENRRMSIAKEQLIREMERYRNNPSPEQKEVFLAMEKSFSALAKNHADSGTVVMKFNQVLPEDFWDREHEPENPRDEVTPP